MRPIQIGNWVFGIDWAPDGKWDWESYNGDWHADYLCLKTIRRDGYPKQYMLTIGPLALAVAYGGEDAT